MCEWRTIARSPIGSRSESIRKLRGGFSDGLSDTAERQEVERPVKVAPTPQPEVGRGERRNEARVERLRQPERRVDAVPADPKRRLVRAQLACVEDAQNLDPAEVRLQQLAVLSERVLPKVPRVLGL